MKTKVTKIDALPKLEKKLRVAAYARVSSEKDAMLQSLSNQISYYNNLIRTTEGWSFVGVYADEALSGTKDTRDEFQRLIKDALEGKIDLILVKSISRFARNTVTMLETVRKLKAIGVDVYFEEQNLHSLSGEGEMVLTFLASFAQDEARSVSENKFIKAYNLMMVDKNAVINDAKDVINKLTDTTTLDAQISKYENEMEIVNELVKKLVKDNSIHLQDQNDYETKYQELVGRHNKAKELYEKLNEEKKYKQAKAITLKSYLSTLENADNEILEWDDALWMTVLDKAIVNRDETITFKFINGKEITL